MDFWCLGYIQTILLVKSYDQHQFPPPLHPILCAAPTTVLTRAPSDCLPRALRSLLHASSRLRAATIEEEDVDYFLKCWILFGHMLILICSNIEIDIVKNVEYCKKMWMLNISKCWFIYKKMLNVFSEMNLVGSSSWSLSLKPYYLSLYRSPIFLKKKLYRGPVPTSRLLNSTPPFQKNLSLLIFFSTLIIRLIQKLSQICKTLSKT
jgi:hypothetical protein